MRNKPILAAAVLSLGATACDPCFDNAVKKQAADPDRSSIEIPAECSAESADGEKWCGDGLSITTLEPPTNVVYVGCSSGCIVAGALAAVDVRPDGVTFTSPSDRPTLTFDLQFHSDPDRQTPYSIYQRRAGATYTWEYVGPAYNVGDQLAAGKVKHFSEFAIVQHVEDEPLPVDVGFDGLRIASEFVADDTDGNRIFVAVVDGAGQLAPDDRLPVLLSFENPDLSSIDPDEAAQRCRDGDQAVTFTCLFPLDTAVRITSLEGQVEIGSSDTTAVLSVTSFSTW